MFDTVSVSVALALTTFGAAATTVPGDSAPADSAPADSAPATATEPNPLELLNALLTTPFPVDELPASFAGAETGPWLDYNDTDLATAIGGFYLDNAGESDDVISGVFIVVYGDRDTLDRYVAEVAGDDLESTDEFCIETVGTALIGAFDSVDDDVVACDLAAVAVAHVESVSATAAGATEWAPADGEGSFGPLQRLNALVYDTAGTALIPYDDPRVGTAVGAVSVTTTVAEAETEIVVLRSDADADGWLLSDPTFADVILREESPDGDLRLTFSTADGVGCASSRGTLVVVSTVASDTQSAAGDAACAAVDEGVAIVDTLAAG